MNTVFEEITPFSSILLMSDNSTDESSSPNDGDSPDGEQGDDNPPPTGGKMKLIIIIAVVVVLLAGVAGFFLLAGEEEKPKQANGSVIKTAGPAVYIEFPKDEIMAVVYDKQKVPHHVVVKVVILTRDDRIKPLIEDQSAIVISEILELIERQKYSELLTYKGKLKLRRKMLEKIRSSLPDYSDAIEKILVTKYLMD